MDSQITIFDLLEEQYKITKPIRLIEFFAGYGSQALALKYLGVLFEHWKICEWAVKSIQAYKDIHFTDKESHLGDNLSKEDLIYILHQLGISSNYNEPMSKEQISRLSEKQLHNIFNNIIITNNLVNIQQVKGKDLEIVDTDKYDYILTYSFPCQDLSLAGKGKGMSDTSTRSGMLWEVERILTECKEIGTMPQILLMENVPQVHGKKNIEDFKKWCNSLEKLGYKNFWKDLTATDFGIPQTRNRTFMISILGNYSYTFPKTIPLKLKLKDMLEENVDEKYYLSDAMIKYISNDNQKWTGNNGEALINKTKASTINTNEGSRRCDASNYICNEVGENYNLKGIHKTLRETLESNNIEEGVNYIDAYNRKIDNSGMAKTISTRVDASNNTYIAIKENTSKVAKPKVLGGIGEKDSNNNTQWKQQNRIYDENVAISVTTSYNPYYKSNLRIRKLTPKECFRLMGVKDEDFENVAKNQCNSSLYHLAGDSIVVNVLMAIFKELL